MTQSSRLYAAGAAGLAAFILAQTFQAIAGEGRQTGFAVLAGIVALLVPYTALAINRFKVAPMAAVLGLIFMALFVASEIVPRSNNLFANQPTERGWIFVTLWSYLLASIAFATATWRSDMRWHWFAPLALTLNALRLVGRLASTFGGVTALNAINDRAYYPAVLIVNGLLLAWFVLAANYSPSP